MTVIVSIKLYYIRHQSICLAFMREIPFIKRIGQMGDWNSLQGHRNPGKIWRRRSRLLRYRKLKEISSQLDKVHHRISQKCWKIHRLIHRTIVVPNKHQIEWNLQIRSHSTAMEFRNTVFLLSPIPTVRIYRRKLWKMDHRIYRFPVLFVTEHTRAGASAEDI